MPKQEKKWRESIVGSPELNDLTDSAIKAKIEAADKNCEKTLEAYHRDIDAPVLFGDTLPTLSADLSRQYEAIFSLAAAWGMYGTKYYQNPDILSDVLHGLEWMYLHMYGEAEIEDRGWRSANDFNWWDWFVGAGEPLTDTMLIVNDHIPMEKKELYLRCFKWVVSFMRQGYFQSCAQSRIRVCTKTALLLEDADWMENEFYDYDLLCEINEDGEGPHIDYIDWTHNYPYNLVYGHNNLTRVLNVGALLGGTALEFKSPKQYNLFKLAKYIFEPIHYKGRGAIIFAGRSNSWITEQGQGVTTLVNLLPMIGLFGEDEDRYIKQLIKRNVIDPNVRERVKRNCAIPELKKFLELLADDTIPYIDGYEIGHAYFTADRAVQQRRDYEFVIALASTRHPSYESINGANKMGWYTGDGALYLSTNNDQNTFNGENFAANEKVMMNVPGTTVDTQERKHWSHYPGIPTGYCEFVGSIDMNKKYVTAAMDYEAYHYEGETVPNVDGNYGGGYIPHKNDLVARKSYFLLDKECVCLGSGITSTTGFPVKTVVENRNLLINSEDTLGIDRTSVDGKALPTEDFETVFDGASYAYLENVAGYVLLDGGKLSVEKYTETHQRPYPFGGRAGLYELKEYETPKRFFKLCVEHGENPVGATYAYATVPYATEEELAEYAALQEVEIISNTPDCQAVRKRSIGISSYVFYKAGACEEIEVSEPCIIMISEEGNEYKLSVCDPTQKLEGITVKVNRSLQFVSADDKMRFENGALRVNMTHSVGRPYTARFEKN